MKIRNSLIFTILCSFFLFTGGCASQGTMKLANENTHINEASIIKLLEVMQTGNGEQRDTARANLLNIGEETVPYLADILKNMKYSESFQPEQETFIFNKYEVYLWDGRNKRRNDYAGTASVALAQIGGNAIPVLVEIIKDKRFDFQLRWRALVGIRFLEKPAPPEVADALISCLPDDSFIIRKLTIEAIGNLLIGSARPELNRLLTDPSPSIEKAAKQAIQKLQEKANEQ